MVKMKKLNIYKLNIYQFVNFMFQDKNKYSSNYFWKPIYGDSSAKSSKI